MTRQLAAATANAFDQPVIPMAVVAYLDIADDPFFGWTGLGDLVFAANETGDPALDGKTFAGMADIFELSDVSEGAGGSDALELSFPGVDPDEDLARQIMRDKRRWQFRRAIVWLLVLDEAGNIVGKPFRIKTGRMDAMPLDESGEKSIIKCVIEGQQAYGSEPLNSRYVEQIDIDPTDTSQKYVFALANMAAKFGNPSAAETNGSIGAGNPVTPINHSIDLMQRITREGLQRASY